jgi:hypothetical protein
MRFRPGAQGRLCLGIVVTAISAVACAPAPDRARHTVSEYRQDATLRTRQLKECISHLGTQGHTPDCVNVTEAERLEGIGTLRDLPPLALPLPDHGSAGRTR